MPNCTLRTGIHANLTAFTKTYVDECFSILQEDRVSRTHVHAFTAASTFFFIYEYHRIPALSLIILPLIVFICSQKSIYVSKGGLFYEVGAPFVSEYVQKIKQ